jgi:hypothetical protein
MCLHEDWELSFKGPWFIWRRFRDVVIEPEILPGGRKLEVRLINEEGNYTQQSGSRDYINKEELRLELIPRNLDINALLPLGALEILSGY